ncbi:RNA methyltransferase [Ignavibacteria bacterium]|nr:RNA methyltransferase [Bacteroidota bacterium]MCZ2132956.1 RNA methyltransferase [Bacteroidota bacterium]
MKKNTENNYKSLPGTPERAAKLAAALSRRQPGLTAVLENVDDPHNVSAVLRSCDATGVLQAYLLYHSGHSFPALGERSSASARKWVDTRKFDSIASCYESLRKDGKKIYVTALGKEAESIYEVDLTVPVALVFGNEHSGVSDEATALADGNILVPQMGIIQSLNISVACAVTLYEAYRQRATAGMYDLPQLHDDDFSRLYSDWLLR